MAPPHGFPLPHRTPPSGGVRGESILLILGLIFLLGAGIRGGRVLFRAPLATVPILDTALPGEDLPAAEGPLLLYLFRPEDCPAHQEQVRAWGRLRDEEGIAALGLGLGFPSAAEHRERILSAYGVEFPVRFRETARMERLALRLGQRETPLTLLLDSSGRPHLVLPPLPDPASVNDGVEAIRRVVRLLEETGPLSRPSRRMRP